MKVARNGCGLLEHEAAYSIRNSDRVFQRFGQFEWYSVLSNLLNLKEYG